MVGIVIVSHSAELAESLKTLALEMGRDSAKVAAAGGVDDPENPIGTDAVKIAKAVEEVWSEDGVVVFMDMGSALLSAEMALELLEDPKRKNVRLCGAPLVEGVVAAVAVAAIGSDIDAVMNEARSALSGKKNQLGETDAADVVTAESHHPDEDAIKETFTLKNTLGLHARPAARIVRTMSGKDAEVLLRNSSSGGDFVSARSMNSLISLNVRQNDTVEVSFSGPDAKQVYELIAPMMKNNFGESTAPVKSDASREKSKPKLRKGQLSGIPVSPGFAAGSIKQYKVSLPEIDDDTGVSPESERTKLREALANAENGIAELRQQSSGKIGEEEAAIFDAQILLLKDPELLDKVEKRIDEGAGAAMAWKESLGEVISMYDQITGNSLVSTRKIDLIDVGRRVLEELTGKRLGGISLDGPAVLCTPDISPSDAASLNSDNVLAICCEGGSDVSHSAIIARSLGIPAVFNLGKELSSLENGKKVVVDAEKGILYLEPDDDKIREAEQKRAKWLEIKEKAHKGRKQPGKTADDKRVSVLANVGNEHEINQVLDMGAEGVGLFRTEFLFMERESAPDEQEQYEAYREAISALGGRKPLVIRTLDAGGDKPVAYLNFGREENPFLGRRGIRYSLAEPELFRVQLRALLRASAHGRVEVMFPMVANRTELNAALEMLEKCRAELDKEGIKYDKELKTGIMVEVPAAVENLGSLLPLVDFISIGTNDLSQYIMAADRTNATVAALASGYQPALLRVVERIITEAVAAGKDVSMCGEMARDTLMTPLLLAWGLRKFSMSASGIPEFKYRLKSIRTDRLSDVAGGIKRCESAEEVRLFLRKYGDEAV